MPCTPADGAALLRTPDRQRNTGPGICEERSRRDLRSPADLPVTVGGPCHPDRIQRPAIGGSNDGREHHTATPNRRPDLPRRALQREGPGQGPRSPLGQHRPPLVRPAPADAGPGPLDRPARHPRGHPGRGPQLRIRTVRRPRTPDPAGSPTSAAASANRIGNAYAAPSSTAPSTAARSALLQRTAPPGSGSTYERWFYDERTRVQQLRRLIVLCKPCHLVTHFGYANVTGRTGDALAHLKAVRGMSHQQAIDHIRAAESRWIERSGRRWELDLSILANVGIAPTSAAAPLDPARPLRRTRCDRPAGEPRQPGRRGR